MKKAFFFLALLAVVLAPLYVFATHEGGVVPCGGEGHPDCQLCHLFQLISNIINWVFFVFVPVVAPIFVVIGGIYMMVARGDPGMFTQGKNVLTAAVIGIIIVYAAWLFVNTALNALDVAPYTRLGGFGIGWEFACPITN